MDKKTIIGLLLMGLVIFGFMWLNQPSEEELARRKQEQLEKAQIENQSANKQAQNPVTNDSLTSNDIDLLKKTVEDYGKLSGNAENATYTLSNGRLNAILAKNSLSGTISLTDTTLSLTSVLNKNVSAQNYVDAVKIIKEATNEMSKYRRFASFLQGTDSIITLQNNNIKIELSTKGGIISEALLKNYKAFNADHVELFSKATDSYSFILNSTDARYDTKDLYFTPIMINDSSVLMQLDFGGGSFFGLKYSLEKEGYLVKMEVVQQNMQRIIPTTSSDMGFNWHQKMSRHEEGEMFEERNSGIFYKFAGGSVENLSETSEASQKLTDKVKWIGFKNQFFSCVIIADKNFTNTDFKSVPFEKGSVEAKKYLKDLTANTTLDYSSSSANPASFHFFFGPNLYPLLSSYDSKISPNEDLKLTNLIPLGWSFFRWINTGFIIPIFDFLGKYISNYGIIILILTLFIKVILFPLTYKSMISQAKMRILAPDIKKINDQYPGKENAMLRQQKTMALYSQAGASPFSGCLPMLLQLPILFAMFSFFPSCIELRGESFLWVKDLSAPDAIWSWNAQIPFITNYFGNHISLFCLLMTATNIVYTKINMQNQAAGNSMPGMKAMMYMMPLMFLVFFNNYAAGLSYYYFISLLITIIQTYAFRYYVKEDKMRAKMAENAKKPKKKGGFMARLEEAQRQQQATLRAQQAKKGNKK